MAEKVRFGTSDSPSLILGQESASARSIARYKWDSFPNLRI